MKRYGALSGVRVLEFSGRGPGPYGAMLLADQGADVIRIDRPGPGQGDSRNILNRGKRSVAIDLRNAGAAAAVRLLVESADALIEPYRPGVMEKLGLAPHVCLGWNPRLVYARMTGWGQTGPYAQAAGHDLDYIAAAGLLHAVGEADRVPQIPLNVAGDFGGGGAFLAIGVLSGVIQARATGIGTVVDAAMVDGAASLLSGIHTMLNGKRWVDERSANLLDGGAPYYSVYETADERYLAVAPIEPRFFAEFVRLAGIDVDPASQNDRASWPELRTRIAVTLRSRTLADWMDTFAGSDACVAPVETLASAAANEHVRARGSLIRDDNGIQPGIAPRLAGHNAEAPPIGSSPLAGEHTREILAELELDVDDLVASGAAQEWHLDLIQAVSQ